MKRRRRAPRERIADGEYRNVTFRVSARTYNALVAAAEGASFSAFCEEMLERALGLSSPPPASDLLALIRQEVRAALAADREAQAEADRREKDERVVDRLANDLDTPARAAVLDAMQAVETEFAQVERRAFTPRPPSLWG